MRVLPTALAGTLGAVVAGLVSAAAAAAAPEALWRRFPLNPESRGVARGVPERLGDGAPLPPDADLAAGGAALSAGVIWTAIATACAVFVLLMLLGRRRRTSLFSTSLSSGTTVGSTLARRVPTRVTVSAGLVGVACILSATMVVVVLGALR